MTEAEAQEQIARDLGRIGGAAGRLADAFVGGFQMGLMLALPIFIAVAVLSILPVDETPPDRGEDRARNDARRARLADFR